jgi:hypothetical protein
VCSSEGFGIFNHTVVSLFNHTVEHAGFVASNFDGHVTKFTARKNLKLIARGKLTFDGMAVPHCVVQ